MSGLSTLIQGFTLSLMIFFCVWLGITWQVLNTASNKFQNFSECSRVQWSDPWGFWWKSENTNFYSDWYPRDFIYMCAGVWPRLLPTQITACQGVGYSIAFVYRAPCVTQILGVNGVSAGRRECPMLGAKSLATGRGLVKRGQMCSCERGTRKSTGWRGQVVEVGYLGAWMGRWSD